MITNSNLYAERVFAEHPLSLWPLDDNISFLQLFSDAQQNLSDNTYWSTSNLAQQDPREYSETPIPGSTSSRFTLNSSNSYVAEITSNFTLNSTDDFDISKNSGCFSAHVYQESIFIDSFEIGVSYGSVEDTSSFSFDTDVGWHSILHTFDLPENEELTFFIRITFSDSGYVSDFVTQINGVSLGQWSEQYIVSSIGINSIDLPYEVENLITSGSAYNAITVDAYGLDTEINGYYLVKDNKIYAQNFGIPLVFGSNHTTKIFEAPDNNPSIIMPGLGFLNDSGKYNNYTLEAWVRMENVGANPIKIIGAVKSSDGVYVEEGFITLRIGPYFKSYYVGKWYRPMLLHFKYSQSEATLLINGEQVITMPIDISNIVFATQEDEIGNNQDWIGIYGSDFIQPFEIDCVSIYPYLVPIEMAKKRFVYGQGVKEVNLSNDIYSTNSYVFDYSFANYAANSLYPDISPWRSGFANNLDATSTHLTTPNYQLPEVQLKRNSRFLDVFEWYAENKTANDIDSDQYTYITMKPLYERERFLRWSEVYNNGTVDWSSITNDNWYNATNEFFVNENILYSDVSIYYDNINILDQNLESVSGVFRSPDSAIILQPLLYFRNKVTNEAISIELDLNWLKYIYISSAGDQTILHIEKIEDAEYFVAGINIKKLQIDKYSIIGSFFSSLNNISLNIGGYLDRSFGGRIYAIHFNNEFFFEKDISKYFIGSFIAQRTETENVSGSLIEYTANYSLIPSEKDYIVDLDIGVTGYWEDFQPLSFFGKYVTNELNETYYDLDMIQFNFDIPKKAEVNEYLKGYLSYASIDLLYSSYSQLHFSGLTYADFSNILVSGYTRYQELKDVSSSLESSTSYDTSVNAYLSFQTKSEVGNKPYSDFINTEAVSYNNVVEFDRSAYTNTKYEILDNSVILPPKTPDFKDYYLGIHLEIKVRGILYKNLLLRRMELSSIAFDNSSGYPVGTKYSNDVYPFTRENYLFNYKKQNPFTIYKDTSPYLYLTEYSGIFVKPFNSEYERGILVPINKEKQSDYKVGGIQFWTRYPITEFPDIPFKVAKIKSDNVDIDLYLNPESSGKRAKLIAYDYKTGKEYNNFIFFQDSEIVNNPIIYPRQWTAINIAFPDPIEFDNITGRIELYSGMVFNNIGEYKYSQPPNQESKAYLKKWWQLISNAGNNFINNWQDFVRPSGAEQDLTWEDASIIFVPNQYIINGSNEYNNQVGLSISVTEDISSISVYSNGVDTFTDVQWEIVEGSPI